MINLTMKMMNFKIFFESIIIPKRLRRCWDFLKTTILKCVIMPLHSSLRSVFTKSTLKHSLKFAVIAAFGIVTIAGLSGLTPVATSMDQIIARAPDKAVPFTQIKFSARDEYKTDFDTAFSDFKDSCPNATKEKILPLLMTINEDEYLKAPIQFRERAYRLATALNEASADQNNDPKTLALIHIGNTLPDSLLLTNYLQQKRIEIAETLQTDPEIIKATFEWNRTSDTKYKTEILARVSKITLDTLLPDKTISYPSIHWINDNKLDNRELAYYRSNTNQIEINGRLNPVKFQFQTAVDLVTHESVHAFQDIMIEWGKQGHLKSAPEINRHVAVMYANRMQDAGAIRFKAGDNLLTYNGYRTMKTESMAWGFARIGQTLYDPASTHKILSNFASDMVHDFSTTNPLDPIRHNKLIKTIPVASENILSGTIPTICR
jgi:hypothetical protein